MTLDHLRNSFYSDAIKKVIDKDSVVLDLGAGLGLHGFMAAYNGAKKIYLVEPEPIIHVAKQLVKANNLSGSVECIAGKIEEIDLPENVDVIISVFTGNFMLTEDLLPSLFYARDKNLRSNGKLIPDRAIMEVVPVSAPEYYAKHVDWRNHKTHDVDFDLVHNFSANSIYYDGPESRQADFLSVPAELFELDFMTATEASCRGRIQVEISQQGLCHGWLGWFRAHFSGSWLSTFPKGKQTHWRQVFLPLAEPFSVKIGDILSFELNRPEFGEWSWVVENGNNSQKYSTFLSEPISHVAVQRKSDTYKPQLSAKGNVTLNVLSHFDGNKSTSDIVEQILTEHKKLFPTRKLADQFVKDLVDRFSS